MYRRIFIIIQIHIFVMNKQEYTRILDNCGVARHKCKYCGDDIFWKNTNIHFKKDGQMQIFGTSYLTHKKVKDNDYKLLMCEECFRKKFPNIDRAKFNTMCDHTKFAFEISDDDYIYARSRYAMTKERLISKYGAEEGERRWKEYCDIQRKTNTFEYKHEKYGWTKEQFDAFNKSRAVTLENLIRKHGKEKGNQMWQSYCDKQRVTKSWDYLVETYGIEKARQINKSKALTLENFINKYGEDEGTQRYNELVKKKELSTFTYSKISQQIFNKLDEILAKKYTTYYAEKNKEYVVIGPQKIMFLDYFIKELNICIEYNGSCFHGDERVYADDERCNPFDKSLTAAQLRQKDYERYKLLKNNYGITTYIIWELDYDPNTFDAKEYIINTLKIDI